MYNVHLSPKSSILVCFSESSSSGNQLLKLIAQTAAETNEVFQLDETKLSFSVPAARHSLTLGQTWRWMQSRRRCSRWRRRRRTRWREPTSSTLSSGRPPVLLRRLRSRWVFLWSSVFVLVPSLVFVFLSLDLGVGGSSSNHLYLSLSFSALLR